MTATLAPTPLRPADLLRITDQSAAHVLDGYYDSILPRQWDPVDRWATRLTSADGFDVWLISWTPDKHTELHDHAGSIGALTVLSGSLLEYRWTGTELRRRTLDAGDQASFPLGWVHDVVAAPAKQSGWAGGDIAGGGVAGGGTATPTLSVHAYAPPLSAMSYYEVTGNRTLRRSRTVLTDEPE